MGWVPPELPKDPSIIMLYFDELREIYVAGERRQKEEAMKAIFKIIAIAAVALTVMAVHASAAELYVPPKAPPVDEVQDARLDAHDVAMARILERLENLEIIAGAIIDKQPPLKAPRVMATAPVVRSTSVVVPPGHHAHETVTGEVIIHGNENMGSAAAHAGIARPWVRIAEAGEVVSSGWAAVSQDGCPPVGCPVRRRVSVSVIDRPAGGPIAKMGRALFGKQ